MSSVLIVDVKKICRVCLGSELEMVSLFQTQQSPTIAEMLSELIIYKIQHFNELPHLICSECVNLVVSAYKLKEKCEKSERTLLALLDNPLKGICLNKNTQEKGTQTQIEEKLLYPCQYCDEKFINLDGLELHAENIHTNSSNTCRCCSRSFKSISDLKNHLTVFHPEIDCKNYNECHICKRQFTRAAHLIRHIQSKHKFFKVEIESLDEQEVSVISLEEETNNKEESTNESRDKCETLKLVKVDDVEHFTDDENEMPLKLLLESSNTSEIIEDVFNTSLDEIAEISLDSQNSINTEETNVAKNNLPPAKRNRGRPKIHLKLKF
ncbi:zinc finger protein 271-like isoform X2 [Lucilia sericata]|uniref:zinc finger protein 271-like isoform X2 n=1 Tax=Lucilia sericata TaxID=13632 RepID=UPI0018A829A7|nr:zinc finger protein 271-like isoform X2 [Lucilia sericata]